MIFSYSSIREKQLMLNRGTTSPYGGTHARVVEMIHTSMALEFHQKLNSSRAKQLKSKLQPSSPIAQSLFLLNSHLNPHNVLFTLTFSFEVSQLAFPMCCFHVFIFVPLYMIYPPLVSTLSPTKHYFFQKPPPNQLIYHLHVQSVFSFVLFLASAFFFFFKHFSPSWVTSSLNIMSGT